MDSDLGRPRRTLALELVLPWGQMAGASPTAVGGKPWDRPARAGGADVGPRPRPFRRSAGRYVTPVCLAKRLTCRPAH